MKREEFLAHDKELIDTLINMINEEYHDFSLTNVRGGKDRYIIVTEGPEDTPTFLIYSQSDHYQLNLAAVYQPSSPLVEDKELFTLVSPWRCGVLDFTKLTETDSRVMTMSVICELFRDMVITACKAKIQEITPDESMIEDYDLTATTTTHAWRMALSGQTEMEISVYCNEIAESTSLEMLTGKTTIEDKVQALFDRNEDSYRSQVTVQAAALEKSKTYDENLPVIRLYRELDKLQQAGAKSVILEIERNNRTATPKIDCEQLMRVIRKHPEDPIIGGYDFPSRKIGYGVYETIFGERDPRYEYICVSDIKTVTYRGKTVWSVDNMKEYTDTQLEKLWEELEDVLFTEDENQCLVLANNWFIFDAGTSNEYIWSWFGNHYSKGLDGLM